MGELNTNAAREGEFEVNPYLVELEVLVSALSGADAKYA